ncbi:helix-turn-helix transcriptional regulator [Aquihabitans sp. G128]|uniref:PadR family transcriptional regulator n=1 Tax=Aquihabitans sp. G128 TaxID=2849779 RepID=UPI001C24B4C7|nr:helix-turn-helix transcriptional regulator [Aquihabitans sp. G128]QXC61058.1 helix-turn-helix transcriptional regulator [Aquihabitans sp. G128]
MARSRDVGELLLGEWACLGCLAQAPSHGFGVAARLDPEGDVGRVLPLSRPLTYRSLDQLHERGLVAVVGEERGRTGGTRTVFAPTPAGRELLDAWLVQPVEHVRDTRTELLLKLVLGDALGRDRGPLLEAQRAALEPRRRERERDAEGACSPEAGDPVGIWREESALAVERFLDRLA